MIDLNDIPHVKELFARFDALSMEQKQAPEFLTNAAKEQRKVEILFRKTKLNEELYSWADVAISINDLLTRLQYGSIHYLNNGRKCPVWGTTHDRRYKNV